MYEQLVRFPDNFMPSNLERAGLMVAVVTPREVNEIHSNVFGEGTLTLPSFPEDRNLIGMQESIYYGPCIEHAFALDTRNTDRGKYRNDKQQAPREKRFQGPRSKTGCLTCRRSHAKCDEGKEICGRCPNKIAPVSIGEEVRNDN